MDPICAAVSKIVSGLAVNATSKIHASLWHFKSGVCLDPGYHEVNDLKILKGKAKGLINELKKRG